MGEGGVGCGERECVGWGKEGWGRSRKEQKEKWKNNCKYQILKQESKSLKRLHIPIMGEFGFKKTMNAKLNS
jgi:hypothetical protein